MAKASEMTKQAQSLIGIKEGSAEHQALCDLYNGNKPLPRGVKMTIKMNWCAMFASILAIICKAIDIFPIECSCGRMIEKAKEMGIWIEDESITPKEGYFILYDWQDNGKGDNKGWPDHIGYVEKVVDGVITVIEGNYNNAVKRRIIKVNAKSIRGYIAPKYEEETVSNTTTTEKEEVKYKLKTLKKGSTGIDVTIFESIMNKMGYYDGDIDTSFDPKCVDACNAFQKDYPECGTKGKPDGSFGPKCWNKLFSLLGA